MYTQRSSLVAFFQASAIQFYVFVAMKLGFISVHIYGKMWCLIYCEEATDKIACSGRTNRIREEGKINNLN